jgi:hypothetical protein
MTRAMTARQLRDALARLRDHRETLKRMEREIQVLLTLHIRPADNDLSTIKQVKKIAARHLHPRTTKP